MDSFVFQIPTQVMIGAGMINKLPKLTARFGQRVLMVTDETVATAVGGSEVLTGPLTSAALATAVFDRIDPDPTIETVAAGAIRFREHRADVIVAVGGGSVLDTAKGIAIVATHGGDIWQYVGDDLVPGPVPPIMAVPTTSGTGSETTPFAAFTDAHRRRKDGLYSPHISPRIAIVDPKLTRTLPPRITAETGFDTLAHAVEAYTGHSSNPLVDSLAEQVVALVGRGLVRAVDQGEDLRARTDMALASALAGIVITHAGVGAAHGFGMSIGGLFRQPHGRTIGTLLAPTMRYNATAVPARFLRLAQILATSQAGNAQVETNQPAVEEATAAAKYVEQLARRTGIPQNLQQLGVIENDLDAILADCFDRHDFSNNAREMSRESARSFLESIL